MRHTAAKRQDDAGVCRIPDRLLTWLVRKLDGSNSGGLGKERKIIRPAVGYDVALLSFNLAARTAETCNT
jgi:hypothetical protein